MKQLENRLFKLWSYTVSHSFLILRSPMRFPDQDNYTEKYNFNFDIEFSEVAYMEMPNILDGIVINELEDVFPKKLAQYKNDSRLKIFEIKSENKSYYIVAESYTIGKNKWLNEDRISKINLEYDEIIAKSY